MGIQPDHAGFLKVMVKGLGLYRRKWKNNNDLKEMGRDRNDAELWRDLNGIFKKSHYC